MGVVLPSACLSVCLSLRVSVCMFARVRQKPFVQISRNSMCVLPVVVVSSYSDNSAIRNVLPVLWMTSCFHITVHIQRHDGSGHR